MATALLRVCLQYHAQTGSESIAIDRRVGTNPSQRAIRAQLKTNCTAGRASRTGGDSEQVIGAPPVERCLACEADGEQGRWHCTAFLFSALCIGPTEDLDPHLDLQMIKQNARRGRIGSFALFTIGLASEAALHGLSTPSSATRVLFLRNSPFNMHGSVYLRFSNSWRCEVCAEHEGPSQ